MLVVGNYHFFGQIDELAVYNRTLDPATIAANWQKKASDVPDASRLLYYDFDEGPGSLSAANKGSLGATGDLQLGRLMGGPRALDADTKALGFLQEPAWVPGAPVVPTASPAAIPVTVAVDDGGDVRLRLRCAASGARPTSLRLTALTAVPAAAASGAALWEAASLVADTRGPLLQVL